jgi:hypothetical protein
MARRLRAGVVVIAVLMGAQDISGHSSPELTVSALVIDRVDLAPNVLRRAESEAERIYSLIGVKLVWTDTVDRESGTQMSVIVSASAFRGKELNSGALGATPQTEKGRGRTAYVFYDRVCDFSKANGVDLGVMLGHVIAHELGHTLLPDGAHSPSGVMRAQWDLAQAVRAAEGKLTFGAREAVLIRQGLDH